MGSPLLLLAATVNLQCLKADDGVGVTDHS